MRCKPIVFLLLLHLNELHCQAIYFIVMSKNKFLYKNALIRVFKDGILVICRNSFHLFCRKKAELTLTFFFMAGPFYQGSETK